MIEADKVKPNRLQDILFTGTGKKGDNYKFGPVVANSIKIWKTVERRIGGPFKFCNRTPLWHNFNFVCGNCPFVQPSWSSLGVNPHINATLVALTSIVMKVFERLVKSHISSSIPVTLDPLQFAYRSNRSTDDAISHILNSSLTHIDSSNGNYARLLFIDYSSAFNTIVPTKLAVKLSDLGLNTSLCNWIQDFLTGRPQVVKVGQFTSNSITLNVGAPQGCVLSPLLYSLYTHDCVSSHRSTSIIKFADDTVVLGLISNNDETGYLDEVERLTSWCQDNCLSLNVSKTKELIVDFRKRHLLPYTPLVISGTPVERVSSFKYLGVNISEDLTWTTHIQTQVKKARQRLYHL